MLAGTIGASLLGNKLAGKGVLRVGKGRIRAGEGTIRTGKGILRAGEDTVRAGKEVLRAGDETIRAGQIFNAASIFNYISDTKILSK